MNKRSPVSLAPLAALLFVGSALAQTIPSANPSDADRINNRCPEATLSTDPAAPCSDAVPNGLPGGAVVLPPGNSAAVNGNVSAGSTGTSISTTGMPSTGMMNSGTSSNPGAMGTGAVPANGAARSPARR